jgi:heavy metal sensor kinase
MEQKTARRITRGLRFRLTLSYAVFFTLLLGGVGMVFRGFLASSLDDNLRDVLNQEWAAMKGYLHIEKGQPTWDYDRDDPDESFIVGRLRRVLLLTDANGTVKEASDLYATIGEDSPEEVRAVIKSPQPQWRTRTSPQGGLYLIRSGVVFANDKHEAYFVAIGRSLADNQRILKQFTNIYIALLPIVIFGGSLLGWILAGRALTPVTEVARAAQRISGSNLSLRIPDRGAGDELDYLIRTFNRMIERLESSFVQMRQFSTDVSHELRTPITAIRGQLEVALFTAKDAEQYREAILNSLQDIERLSQIVRALLLLSQAESGQVTLQKTRLDLTSSLRDIIEQFQIPAEEAQVVLVQDLPDQECPAELDRVQIDRMVSNLVSNALKFTPPGGQVRVSLRPDVDWVELVIEDTGFGIAQEHLPHIFDRFYRVPNSDSSPEKGLGLGLSFVSWIVKAHGGTIDVASEKDKGTRFTIRLPIGNVARPEPAPHPAELQA